MKERMISCLIGYLFGCFLTAEVVAKKVAGKSSSELGVSGNPGMANIMSTLGFVPGIITLLGDILKTLLALAVSRLLFPNAENSILIYAGFGCAIGHDFPFWRKFKGGKGVAVTCTMVLFYHFLWGLAADLGGAAVVIITKYLCLAGPATPLIFAIGMLIEKDYEAAILSFILTLIALKLHWPFIAGIRTHETRKDDVIAAIRKKMKRK